MADPPIRQQVMKYLAAQFPRATLADHQLGADGLLAIFEAEAARVRAEAVAERRQLEFDKRVVEADRDDYRRSSQDAVAEAVADERQWMLAGNNPARAEAMKAVELHVGPNLAGWPAFPDVYFGGLVDRVVEAYARAAGSVPVATPPDECDHQIWAPHYVVTRHPDGSVTTAPCPGPAAIPTEPADPTYGRIDPDIQRAVDALEPESIGSRVAMENTLQARRDAATPTEPGCALHPGLLCDLHDGYCAEPRCEGPCDCGRPGRLAEHVAASPAPAVQPPAHDPGCERQLHNDWCLCVQRAAGRGEGWPS